MALDPSISLQVQPVQVQNPLTQYAQVAAIQDAQARNRLLDLTMQDKQREIGQNAALNDAYAKNLNPDGSVNAQGLVGSVAQSGYGSAIPGIQKSLSDAATAKLAQQKSQIEVGLQRFGALGQVLNGVTDQATYTAAIQHAADAFGPQAVANVPAAYDPQFVANTKAQALTVQQQLEQHNKLIDQQLAQSQFGETQRHNQATEASATRGQDMTAATEMRGQNLRAQDYDPKSGAIVNKITGQSTPVLDAQGNPIASPAANLTGEQSNAVAFGARATDAQSQLRNLEAGGVTSGNRLRQAAGGVPVIGGALASAANALPTALGGASDQQQQYEQAQRNFVSAVLRKESGAAISNEEYANEAQKYFPQPGDTDVTIEQKARARDLAIEGLKAQAGPGASLIPQIIQNADKTYATQPQPQSAQKQPQQAAPAQIAPDAARAELLRRAQNNPALLARLQAMGH